MLKITFLIMGFPINSSQFLSQFAQILHPIRYSNHFPTIHSPYSNRASPSIPSDLFPPLPRPPWYHPWLSQRLSHTRTSSQKNYGHPWLYMSDFPSFCDVCLQMFTGFKTQIDPPLSKYLPVIKRGFMEHPPFRSSHLWHRIPPAWHPVAWWPPRALDHLGPPVLKFSP